VDGYDWDTWLREWNRQLLEVHEASGPDAFTDPLVTPAVLASGWLGAPGASEEELSLLEARLGMGLPPSYRSFLRASDGFLQPGMIVPRLLAAHQVQWFRDVDPDTIEIWTHGLTEAGASAADRFERYLPTALQVSAAERVGSAVYLLNPGVVGADGEWEAFYFAHWVPGADRYPSFWVMMQREQEVLQARNAEQSRAAPVTSMLDALKWLFRPPAP